MVEKKRKSTKKTSMPTKSQTKVDRGCFCPYCDEEIRNLNLPFCQACGVAVLHCEECHIPLPKEAKFCPQCGNKVG